MSIFCLDSPLSQSSLLLIFQDYTLPSPSRTKAPLGRGRNTGLIGHCSSFGMVRAWHHGCEWMFLPVLFITMLISMSYQHWWPLWNNLIISNQPQQWQPWTPSTSHHPLSMDLSFNSNVVKLQSFHNRATAAPQLLQHHLYTIIPWTSFHLPSLWTLSHPQCPSSSCDPEGCTPSSHYFIPSPLTVLLWGIVALTSGWM